MPASGGTTCGSRPERTCVGVGWKGEIARVELPRIPCDVSAAIGPRRMTCTVASLSILLDF